MSAMVMGESGAQRTGWLLAGVDLWAALSKTLMAQVELVCTTRGQYGLTTCALPNFSF